MFITRGNLNKQLLQAYDSGGISREQDITNAYASGIEIGIEAGRGLGRAEGRAEANNKGYIIPKILTEAERILEDR